MTRRLLDVFSLVVLTMMLAAPASLRAQKVVEDRVAGPGLVVTTPVLPIEPPTVPLRFPSPPSPNLPRRYPVPLPPGIGLKQMVQAAGLIFSGRVIFVGNGGSAGIASHSRASSGPSVLRSAGTQSLP